MFTRAIVRTPGRSIINGVTTADLGIPDYKRVLQQHERYIEALRQCGLEVTIMLPQEEYPDSTFVEDCAVLAERCAIIGNLGVGSRKGEESSIEKALRSHYADIRFVRHPGTLEGGDVLRVGEHFYVGITRRTNVKGAEQLISILGDFGYTASTVPVVSALHLKTGVAYLGDNNIVLAGEFVDNPAFADHNAIVIDDDESYAANCIRVNDYVLMPAGYRESRKKITGAGFSVIEIDVSEFRKIDGGISCLSLRH
ncbi:MAG: arginine deiminase family protein [candidate division WOR-3 bacterium]|nr:arginine deiminase family protein [candidate division WOR-3 bacterium]